MIVVVEQWYFVVLRSFGYSGEGTRVARLAAIIRDAVGRRKLTPFPSIKLAARYLIAIASAMTMTTVKR
jgi:hypothetical protein